MPRDGFRCTDAAGIAASLPTVPATDPTGARQPGQTLLLTRCQCAAERRSDQRELNLTEAQRPAEPAAIGRGHLSARHAAPAAVAADRAVSAAT